MTVAGLITTLGLFLVLGYALKRRADNSVFIVWAWLFICMCASTAAYTNNVSSENYVWWYGIPATLAMLSLTARFVRSGTFDGPERAIVGLFGFNTLALASGLEGVVLFAGVTLLAVTVWMQILLTFLLAGRESGRVLGPPPIRTQRKYDDPGPDNNSVMIRTLTPLDNTLWGWDIDVIFDYWRVKRDRILHRSNKPKNGIAG